MYCFTFYSKTTNLTLAFILLLPFSNNILFLFEPKHEKTNFLVSNQLLHKPGPIFATTEDRNLEFRAYSEYKDAVHLCGYLICVFVFAYAKCWFSHNATQLFYSTITTASEVSPMVQTFSPLIAAHKRCSVSEEDIDKHHKSDSNTNSFICVTFVF